MNKMLFDFNNINYKNPVEKNLQVQNNKEEER